MKISNKSKSLVDNLAHQEKDSICKKNLTFEKLKTNYNQNEIK